MDALDAEESREILGRLLQAHPDLRAEAGRLASELIGSADPETVAANLSLGLELLAVEDVYERSGSQRDGGHVDPSEVAWELPEAEVEPFLEDMRRRAGQGQLEAAGTVALGVLLALYRCPDDAPNGSVLAWAEDFAQAHATHVLDTLRELGGELPPGAEELMPIWSGLLHQSGGR